MKMRVWASISNAAGDTRYAVRMWLLCVGLPCLALVSIGAVATIAEAHPQSAFPSSAPRVVCAPVVKHSPNPEDRPCDVIQVSDNGAASVLFQTANARGIATGEYGRCYLPNVFTQRGRYVAHCTRVQDIGR